MPENTNFPRLLVISNSCLSNSTSNGRTLRNFLIGWDKNRIAQFYIQNEEPDFDVCNNFYRVTDGQALKSFLKGASAGGKVEGPSEKSIEKSKVTEKKRGRNPLTMLLREVVWNSRRWENSSFKAWLDDFSPEVVLLQAGDSPFMLKIAMRICKERKIPLVMYNSEVYYFKNFDYFRSTGLPHLMYPIFSMYYKAVFKKTIKLAKKSIYNCDTIKEEYDKEFGLPSLTIYTATQAEYAGIRDNGNSFVVSYLGNLGVGRHESLIEIAEALQNISSDYKLDVYGKIPDETVKTAFDNCKGINYKGFVSYDEVLEVMKNSNLLVHAESFSDFYRKDLQYAFSTKIADSLATGVGFLLYAPEEMACSKYLKENDAAFVVCNKAELLNTLNNLVQNPEKCKSFTQAALNLSEKNHNFSDNSSRFQNVIKKL